MIIKNDKDFEKWVRECTLDEIKDTVDICMRRYETKQLLARFLIDLGMSMNRRFGEDERNNKEDPSDRKKKKDKSSN